MNKVSPACRQAAKDFSDIHFPAKRILWVKDNGNDLPPKAFYEVLIFVILKRLP